MIEVQAIKKMSATAMGLQLSEFFVEKFIMDFKPKQLDKQKLNNALAAIQTAAKIYGHSSGINIDDSRVLVDCWFSSGTIGYWLLKNIAILPSNKIDDALQALKYVFDDLLRAVDESEAEHCKKYGLPRFDIEGTLLEYDFKKNGINFYKMDSYTIEVGEKLKIKKGRGIVYFGRMPVCERELMEILNWVL